MITRIELIDHTGRKCVLKYAYPVEVQRDIQDDGKTLKIFVRKLGRVKK